MKDDMVFKLKIISDAAEADVETLDSIDLYDFAEFLTKTFSSSDIEMTSFFTSNQDWDRIQEYTAIDMGFEDEDTMLPLAMKGVKLADLMKKKFDRLIFVQDPIFDQILYIELMGCSMDDMLAEYPRVVK